MIRLVERVKLVLILVGFVAFMFVLGSAGSVELDVISLEVSIQRVLLGVAVLFLCFGCNALLNRLVERFTQNRNRLYRLDRQEPQQDKSVHLDHTA